MLDQATYTPRLKGVFNDTIKAAKSFMHLGLGRTVLHVPHLEALPAALWPPLRRAGGQLQLIITLLPLPVSPRRR